MNDAFIGLVSHFSFSQMGHSSLRQSQVNKSRLCAIDIHGSARADDQYQPHLYSASPRAKQQTPEDEAMEGPNEHDAHRQRPICLYRGNLRMVATIACAWPTKRAVKLTAYEECTYSCN